MIRFLALLASVMLLLAGCVPYAVGSTAETVSPGRETATAVAYAIPNGIRPLRGDSAGSTSFVGMDHEVRFGLTPISDIGVRVPSYSGVVVNYKYRFAGEWNPPQLMLAVMPGAGMVNFGNHAHLEFSLLASLPSETGNLTPYGGLRAMQVIPISGVAVRDSPTLGGFLGLRIGSMDRGVSPELGIYYDRSALDLRDSSIIFVPALTVQGADLLRHLF